MSEARKTVLDDRYDVVRPLGSGGMGEVFLARDRVLGRDVALKVLRKQYAGDEEFAERFKREAMSAASLSHQNIVQVYDRGETEEGASYIAMEYVPGGTLSEQIEKRGPFEANKAVAVAAQIAGALEVAHEWGVIHCDIKPQNVLVTSSGDLKVTDFGIARAASASVTNAIFGTAGYISPEQAMGEPVCPASDLYSLGVILYEMLTGELPYTADNPIAVCMKHVKEPLRPPRSLNPTIPEEIDALVVKLLAKDPADRYRSAGELLYHLERLRSRPISGPPTGPTRRREPRAAHRRAGRPRSVPLVLTAVALSALVLLGTLVLGLSQQEAGRASLPRTQSVARGFIELPRAAQARTAKTQADTTLDPLPLASPAASDSPVVPTTPPAYNQTPTQSQYGASGN
jgi:serine/threonine-protein kinase